MRKHNYDKFFDVEFMKNESEHLHYFVPEFRKPKKLIIKEYNEENELISREFLVPTRPEPVLPPEDLNPEDFPVQTSLLEVPIQRRRREVMDEVAERLQNQANEEELKIEESSNSKSKIKENLLWTDKYTPNSFIDLLSDDEINRQVLSWLKSWDPIAQNKKLPHKFVPIKKEMTIHDNQKPWEMTYDLEDKFACEILRNKVQFFITSLSIAYPSSRTSRLW